MTRFLKQKPITIFFLLLTALVFMAMQLVYGSQATSSQAIYQFGGMYGLADVASGHSDFCAYWLGAFFCECLNPLFCWSNG